MRYRKSFVGWPFDQFRKNIGAKAGQEARSIIVALEEVHRHELVKD
jgi:hypothetical protein